MDREEARNKCAIFDYIENKFSNEVTEIKKANANQDKEMREFNLKLDSLKDFIDENFKYQRNGYKEDLAEIFINKLKEEQKKEKNDTEVVIKKRNLGVKVLSDIAKIGIGVLISYLTLKGWL